MQKEVILTDNSPKAIGPYSQAIRFDNLMFISGQIPINQETSEIVSGDIGKQTEQVLENLKNILVAGGSSLLNVLRTTIYLTNIDDYAKVNEIYARYFENIPPARSTVEVSRLPKAVSIEIDAIAFIS